jgi:hypothetical protein
MNTFSTFVKTTASFSLRRKGILLLMALAYDKQLVRALSDVLLKIPPGLLNTLRIFRQ